MYKCKRCGREVNRKISSTYLKKKFERICDSCLTKIEIEEIMQLEYKI